MPVTTDNRIRLSGGQTLGYAQYGDPGGKPVLHFHGLPSSRFELFTPATDEIATRLGARVLVIDRPGIGISDYHPYSISAWPDLVVEFAEALHLDRFAVMGYSSGGKYVAACAWKIPARLTSAGIVSGNCSYDLPGARLTLSRQDKLLYTFADKLPLLLRFLLWIIARNVRKNPASVLSLFPETSQVDKNALVTPEIQRLLTKMVGGAFQQGTRAAALDWQLEARSWGFPLKDIQLPVQIWHGGQDKIVATEQGRIMAGALSGGQLKIFPDDGHISLMMNHYEELLGTIISGG